MPSVACVLEPFAEAGCPLRVQRHLDLPEEEA